MQNIPIEHQLKCKGCGKILDMRDIDVLSHGWVENGVTVCFDDAPKIPYSGSKKVGEPIQWTPDKRRIDLN